MKKPTQWLLFPSILVLPILLSGLFLRVWGIDFDLPYHSHPDEHHEINRALRLGTGDFEYERVLKGGYFYLLFVEYGIFFVLLRLLGAVSSVHDFMLYFFRDPSYFWLIGRTTTALLGTMSVWLVYRIGTRLASHTVGILAAALLAFSSLDSMYAHFVTVDIPMTFCVLVTFYFALRIHDSGRLPFYLLAGLTSALSVMTKASAAPVVPLVVLAHLLRARHEQTWGNIVHKNIILYFMMTLVVYVVGNPGFVLLVGGKLRLVQDFASREFVSVGTTHWLYYANATSELLGWPLVILSVLGIGFAVYRHKAYDLLLLCFPVLLYAAISAHETFLHNPRYILPALPFVFLLIAQFLDVAMNRLRLGARWNNLTLTILTIILCAPQAHATVRQNLAFSRPGNPILCKEWFEANVPAGAKILLEGWPGAAAERRLCPLKDKPENIEKWAAQIEKDSPMGAFYARMKASTQEGSQYDLTIVQPKATWLEWDEANNTGINYVVMAPKTFPSDSSSVRDEATESRLRFYRVMMNDANARLVKRLDDWHYDDYASKRGLGIEIYEISDD